MERKTVPVVYVISSALAFVCIVNLTPCPADSDSVVTGCTEDKGFGSFQTSFRYWLHGLHLILIMPMFASRLFPSQPRLDAVALYGALAVASFCWHIGYVINQDPDTSTFLQPITDCQISITADLVLCTVLTLYAVYRDNLRAARRNGCSPLESSQRALAITSLATLAVPLVSPGAVLAAHLCSCHLETFHCELVSYLQRMAAQYRQKGEKNEIVSHKPDEDEPHWCNLGLWSDEHKVSNKIRGSYENACEQLALALGHHAALNENDAVLCCGCGTGRELSFYKNRFKLRHITGIDPHVKGKYGDDDFNVRRIQAKVEDLCVRKHASYGDGSITNTLFPQYQFNKILALDNIYHYKSKRAFYEDCADLLPQGGRVAVTDVILRKDVVSLPLWVRVSLFAMGVPSRNIWTAKDYHATLKSHGFVDINIKPIGHQVFSGWTKFLPLALLKYLDYALISGALPSSSNGAKKPHKRKQKVAIIGSGMAGLAASHAITSSKRYSSDVSVTIFEANPLPGLAGHSTFISSQLVDVPARMSHEGYYKHLGGLLSSLGLATKIVRTDCTYYGDDGSGGKVVHAYDKSMLYNAFNTIFHMGLKPLKQLVHAVSATDKEKSGSSSDTVETFGDWMILHFRFKNNSTKNNLPSLTCRENPFLYITIGSLCWMLSCTYEQLTNYPVDIVLPYLRECVDGSILLFGKGQVARVDPSIRALQQTLLYGVDALHCNKRVTNIDEQRVIDGVAYDAIICATEAKAVTKVMKHSADVFSKMKYHPSVIYLHTDETFMPPNKSDWRCWNVEQQSSGREEPQLTFWLNEFYPNSAFDSNVFQTWAPLRDPPADLVIKRFDLQRVVHTKDTREHIDQIQREQGENGIYFAGSYCEYGMGLLEEASISGTKIAEAVLRDLFEKSHGVH